MARLLAGGFWALARLALEFVLNLFHRELVDGVEGADLIRHCGSRTIFVKGTKSKKVRGCAQVNAWEGLDGDEVFQDGWSYTSVARAGGEEAEGKAEGGGRQR